MDALSAWVLTMTLSRGDIRNGAVFPDESSCVRAGEKWYGDAVEYARRKKLPRPTGWLCIPTDALPKEASS